MIVIGFILGTILGSFVKALADRSLAGKTFRGRSYCASCKHTLQWYDLLPVFSYLMLSGKCRYCHKKIPVEYLLVEVVMGVLIGFLFFLYSDNLNFLIYNLNSNFKFQILISLFDLLFKTFFISVLAVLFLTDLKEMFIPDRIVIPAIVISIIFIIFITIIKIIFLYYSLTLTPLGRNLLPPHTDFFQRHALITAEPLIGSILMGFLIGGFFMALIIITKGKGMGGGDVKLGAFMGLGLGFPNSLVALISAFLIGAIFSLVLIMRGKKHFKDSIAFGPFLVLGSLLALFWGQQITDWYLHLST